MQDNVALKRKTEAWQRIINKLPTDTHTHTRLMALCPGLPGWACTRKVKPVWILLNQDTVSAGGISWAICKSAPRFRQMTMPAPYHSVFFRPDALPATQPTASKHWRQKLTLSSFVQESIIELCLEVRLTIGGFVLSLPTVLPLPVGYTGIGRVMSG